MEDHVNCAYMMYVNNDEADHKIKLEMFSLYDRDHCN